MTYRIATFAFALAIPLIVSACGGGDDEESTETGGGTAGTGGGAGGGGAAGKGGANVAGKGGAGAAGAGAGGASGNGGAGTAGASGAAGGKGGASGSAGAGGTAGNTSAGAGGSAGNTSAGAGGSAGNPSAGAGGSAGNTSAGAGGSAGTAGASGNAGASGGTGGTGTGRGPACTSFPDVGLTVVATGLSNPIHAATEPADASRLYALEKGGKIKLFKGAPSPSIDFLSLTVAQDEEGGLHSIAFHPDYAQNGRFFVQYTSDYQTSNVVEYARSPGDPDKATPTPVKTWLTVKADGGHHYGGQLAFGPDGALYSSHGDHGDQSIDTGHVSQQDGTHLGKIVRIDLASGDVSHAHKGLRNPWRFSFDRLTGDIFIGDVGASTWEEIDWAPAGQSVNFGWPILEGPECYGGGNGCAKPASYQAPIVVHPGYTMSGKNLPFNSISGGFLYRGTAIPCMVGWYVYGDFGTARVHATSRQNGAWITPVDIKANLGWSGAVSSFGEDANGEILIVSFGGGTVSRIVP